MEKLAPKDAVRAYCTQCLGLKQFNTDQVRACQGNQALNGPCRFYPYRLGKRPSVKAFRNFCLECMCGSSEGIKECLVADCPCHPYRFGKNPSRKGQGMDVEQMKKVRESRKNAQISIFRREDIQRAVL